MTLFKCKMCGGTLEINNESVATCEYCGTQQTLPRLDDDRKTNLYDRANHFRRNNEFDKAMGIYEQILNEDNTDAEAYWSLVLCRYGIEYVEDPSSHKRIPTVNRTQFTSVFDDDNYKSALQYADGYQRNIYEEEARAINEIQKGILAISQKEEPFDVFICYKETDNNGRRTPDSVLANDLYHQLTQEGFKVFFSRITLEDKLGTAYEPYIFAALNSSKVMVVLGTRPEYFNAVWVKNEWSRYLALIRGGVKKILIPAYRDMDPYDLPEEFSHLQSQDMSKLGFMQDLIRGIKKLTQEETPKTTVVKETVVTSANANTVPLLKRVFMFLEDEEWVRADDFCEQVLNLDPECAEAYLGKLMVELKVTKKELLKDCTEPFDSNNNYKKALRFGNEKLSTELVGYIEHINARNEEMRLLDIYTQAHSVKAQADEQAIAQPTDAEHLYKEAAKLFESIHHYKDSDEQAKLCYENGGIARKNAFLIKALELKKEASYSNVYTSALDSYKAAIILLETIPGWKDADQILAECKVLVENLKPEFTYRQAVSQKNIISKTKATASSEYERIAALFASISDYKDANQQAEECLQLAEVLKAEEEARKREADEKIYCEACKKLEEDREYACIRPKLIEMFESIAGYKDADQKLAECKALSEDFKRKAEIKRKKAERKKKFAKKIAIITTPIVLAFLIIMKTVIIPGSKYNDAVALMDAGEYVKAISAFEVLDGYKDSGAKIDECNTAIRYNDAVVLMDAGEYAEAISAFEVLDGYKDSENKISECNTAILDGKYSDAVALMEEGKYTEAISAFKVLDGYRDSTAKIYECNYNDAVALVDAGEYAEAAVRFGAAGNYSDAHEKATALWDEIAVRDVVSAGGSHTAGLKSDGTVVAVGFNGDGRCNVSDWRDIVAVSAGYAHTVGLKSDGTVVATGQITFGECNVSSWTDIVAVSARSNHTVGLKADGTVVATGSNDVSGWRDIVAVSAGSTHTVGLKSDGMVVAVGENFFGQCDVSGWRDIVAVSVGYTHTVGLKSDGTVVAVGSNRYGQCDVSGWRDIVAVFAGSTHTVGLKSDGTVVATGDNEYGQCDVSGWTDIVAVSAGSDHTVGLKSDGTVVAVGDNEYGECDVSGWRGIRIPQN